MPIGAFRLNAISRALAAAAPANASITSLGITAPASYINNYQHQLAYAGQDSSNRPVFIFSYSAVTTAAPSAVMFRINSDMTTTVGTPVSVGTTAAGYTGVICKTERDDSGLRTSSGFTDYAYFGWNNLNQVYASSASYNLDTLALSAGSELSIHAVNSGGIFLAYMGNRSFAIGGQGGNNGNTYVTDVVTRTSGSTTLTKRGYNVSVGYFGQAGGHIAYGAGPGRFVIMSNTNNGHDGNYIAVKDTGSTLVGQTVKPFYLPTTSTFNFSPYAGLLNTSGKVTFGGYGSYSGASALRTQVLDNAWNPASTGILPSSSEGNILTDAASLSGWITMTNGSVDNEAYYVYVHNASSYNLRYKKMTVNQDTVTEGSWTSFDNEAQGGYALDSTSAKGVTVGSDFYLVAVARDGGNNLFRVAAQKLATSSAITQGSTVLRMEYITSVTGTSSTITIPATAQAGDFAILFDRSTTITNTIPSGWTSINGVTTSGIRSNISYKKLVSGDPGATITGMAGIKLLMIFRSNTGTFTTATFSTPNGQATTATPTAQTVVVSGQATPNLVFAHYASTGTVTTRTFTGFTWNDPLTAQQAVGGSVSQYVKWYSLNKGNDDQTSNFTISSADNGTNTLQSFRVSFS